MRSELARSKYSISSEETFCRLIAPPRARDGESGLSSASSASSQVASFTDSNSLFKTLLKEGRDPTDEELNAIRDENNALYEQLQSS